MNKLTTYQITESIALYENGMSFKAIGNLFGVSDNAIRGLLNRRGLVSRTLSQSRRTLACNHNYFNEPLDESRAYWIGFILADGSVNEKCYGRTTQLSIALADKDHAHLEKFKNAIASEHKIITVDYKTGHLGARLSISSSELVDSLSKFNIFPNKSANQLFSDLIPHHLLPHYFRGYFDGNGSISRHQSSKWAISNVSSESFLKSFLTWVYDNTHASLPPIGFSYGIWRVGWAGTHRCKEILDLMYKDASIYLDRKKTLYDDICHDAESSNRTIYNLR